MRSFTVLPARVVCLFALSLLAVGGALPALAAEGLEATFTPEGQMTLRLDGAVVMEGPAAGSAPQVRFRDPAAEVGLFGYSGEAAAMETQLTAASFDPATRTALQRFAWGTVARTYDVKPDRLDCTLTVHNASDKTLYFFAAQVLDLRVPAGSAPARVSEATFFGQTIRAKVAESLSGPLVLPLLAGDRALVACSPEAVRHLQLRWNAPPAAKPKTPAGKHGDPAAQKLADQQAQRLGPVEQQEPGEQWTLTVQAGGDHLVWHDRYASRPIAPGASDTYVVSLRAGSADAPLAPAADVCAAYAQAHPMLLQWNDRRPILRTFIGDWFPHHPPVDLAGSKPQGVPVPDDFRKKVLASTDQLIENLKLADAQGMVIWNVEGSMVPSIKYVGDPQSIETMCPEMDALADEYFARIRAAGFHTGICIRPTTLIPAQRPDGSLFWRHSYPRDDNPVDALSRKIQYAKDRWGCTLFYIDTNHNFRMPQTDEERAWWPKAPDGKFKPYRELMSAEQWQELARRHPDILLIPEHSYLLCYTATGPYDQMNMGNIAGAGPTPELVRATWPTAFKCLTGDNPLTKYFPRTVAALAQGDVVMLNSPVEDAGRSLAAARQLAQWHRQPRPKDLADLPAETRLALATDANTEGARRYHAAASLTAGDAPAAPDTLAALLGSEDWLVRKLALDAVHTPQHAALVPQLLAMAAEHRSSLRFAAGEALTRLGPAVLPALSEAARGTDRGLSAAAARALCDMPTPDAFPAALAVLQDPQATSTARGTAAQQLARTAGGERAEELTTALLPLLDDRTLRVNVAAALGSLKDPRIAPALEAALRAEQAQEKPEARFLESLQRALGQQKR